MPLMPSQVYNTLHRLTAKAGLLGSKVVRGRRRFTLGYKVHTACYISSELPLAFTVGTRKLTTTKLLVTSV
jgi:hypothetical protein